MPNDAVAPSSSYATLVSKRDAVLQSQPLPLAVPSETQETSDMYCEEGENFLIKGPHKYSSVKTHDVCTNTEYLDLPVDILNEVCMIITNYKDLLYYMHKKSHALDTKFATLFNKSTDNTYSYPLPYQFDSYTPVTGRAYLHNSTGCLRGRGRGRGRRLCRQ